MHTTHGLSWGQKWDFKDVEDIKIHVLFDDEEVEVEVDRIEEDEEVAQIYKDAKDKHRKIMTSGFKSNEGAQLEPS